MRRVKVDKNKDGMSIEQAQACCAYDIAFPCMMVYREAAMQSAMRSGTGSFDINVDINPDGCKACALHRIASNLNEIDRSIISGLTISMMMETVSSPEEKMALAQQITGGHFDNTIKGGAKSMKDTKSKIEEDAEKRRKKDRDKDVA